MTPTVWTEEKLARLRELYPTKTNAEIAEIFGTTKRAVQARANLLGIYKPKEFYDTHDSGRFKKGFVPANKGKKVSPEAYERMKATMFRKGEQPHNTKYDGYESVMEQDGRKYVWVRLSVGKFVQKQRLEWEKANGPIPKGMLLRCRNDDTLDCRPENWYLVTRAENAMLNKSKPESKEKRSLSLSTYHHPELREVFEAFPELAELKLMSNQLNREIYGKIRKRKKRKGGTP